MFCSYCGATNPDDGRFCSGCGKGLAATPASSGARRSGATPYSAAGRDPWSGAQTELGLQADLVLLERYRIRKELGMGGMGRVYLAEDETLGTSVAIKVLRDLLSRDPGSVQRLKKEAKLAMQLSHPNIVRVHDYYEAEIIKFLAMEYVEGETLAHVVARQGTLPEDEVRRMGVAICQGLEHAHAKRIIHRDLKPGNILLGKDKSIKIADFGIARICRDSMSRLTSQMDSGTLTYMSPEQLMGESTEQSDVYSLGVILYELLSGEVPFHSGDIQAQIREKFPKPLPNVSAQMNHAVLMCLAKMPEGRPVGVRGLRQLLENGGGSQPSAGIVRTAPEAAAAPRIVQPAMELPAVVRIMQPGSEAPADPRIARPGLDVAAIPARPPLPAAGVPPQPVNVIAAGGSPIYRAPLPVRQSPGASIRPSGGTIGSLIVRGGIGFGLGSIPVALFSLLYLDRIWHSGIVMVFVLAGYVGWGLILAKALALDTKDLRSLAIAFLILGIIEVTVTLTTPPPSELRTVLSWVAAGVIAAALMRRRKLFILAGGLSLGMMPISIVILWPLIRSAMNFEVAYIVVLMICGAFSGGLFGLFLYLLGNQTARPALAPQPHDLW